MTIDGIVVGAIIGFAVCRLIDLHYYEGLSINWHYLKHLFRGA